MKNKKGDINQVFVYVFSIIIVGFAGFLVIEFVSSLMEDSKMKINTEFFSQIENNYETVSNNWGEEKIKKLKVTENVEYVCFIDENCDRDKIPIDEDVTNTLIEGGTDIALFETNSSPIEEESLDGNISVENNCQCGKPDNGIIEIGFFNERNDITIEFMD